MSRNAPATVIRGYCGSSSVVHFTTYSSVNKCILLLRLIWEYYANCCKATYYHGQSVFSRVPRLWVLLQSSAGVQCARVYVFDMDGHNQITHLYHDWPNVCAGERR